MKTHLKLIAGIAVLGSVAAVSTVSAQQAFTKPVGYRTETIKAGVFNLIGVNLTEKVSAAGEITAIAGTTVTDDNADFVTSLPTDAGQTYVLQITGGAQTGLVSEVASVVDATNVTTADDLAAAGVAAGATYEIRRAKTLNDIFGPANEVGLKPGGVADGTVIWIPGGDGTFARYVFQDNFLGKGWRSSTDTVTDQGNTPVVATDAIFVQSRNDTDLSLVLVGHVSTTPATVPLIAGFNFNSNIFPVGGTLGTSTLGDQLTKGPNADSSDVVWLTDGAGGYTRYFFQDSFLGTGWRSLADPVNDASGAELTSGIIIQNRGDAKNVTINPPAFYADL